MEEKKSSITTKAKEFWQGLSRTLRVLIVAVLAVLLVVIVYLVAVSGRVEYEVLQSGLSSAQAAADRFWTEARQRMEEYCAAHEELQKFLGNRGGKDFEA